LQAQQHRALGRHISQTKAINTGTYLWMAEELAVMEAVGNGVASAVFTHCGPKPSRDAPSEEKLAYARNKYDGGTTPTFTSARALNDAVAKATSSPNQQCAPTLKQTPRPPPVPQEPSDLISFDDTPTAATSQSSEAFFAQFGL